jgi:hypothetical protein
LDEHGQAEGLKRNLPTESQQVGATSLGSLGSLGGLEPFDLASSPKLRYRLTPLFSMPKHK